MPQIFKINDNLPLGHLEASLRITRKGALFYYEISVKFEISSSNILHKLNS
jgi:hypothetical protein